MSELNGSGDSGRAGNRQSRGGPRRDYRGGPGRGKSQTIVDR